MYLAEPNSGIEFLFDPATDVAFIRAARDLMLQTSHMRR